jgi:hypothetical protein
MIEDFLLEYPLTSLIIIIALVAALAVGVVAVPAHYAADHACGKRAAIMQTEYQYGFWEGCWIKKDNAWVEYNTIRNVGVQHE